MGTMLQGYDLTLADFDGLEGCNEMLNLTRPDVVRAIHDAYFEAGVDAVETNTFGANLAALGEYGIADRDLRAVRRGGPDRPGLRRRPRRPPTGLASCSAASGRAPSCRPSATSASPRCATPTRPRSRGCSAAASTRC